MKRFLWFALWLATAGGAFAQEADPYAGQKAQIREIKLSNEYYYSDVSSEDPEETRGMARQLLVLAIQQEEPEALGVDSLVADSCRYIELKRIDQPRFFAYISKEAVAVWLFRKKHPGEPLPSLAATPADTLAGKAVGSSCGGYGGGCRSGFPACPRCAGRGCAAGRFGGGSGTVAGGGSGYPAAVPGGYGS